jgi:Tol biopolymer transport system component/DNA-binding winged helix-turn-helix (wHTH) protein
MQSSGAPRVVTFGSFEVDFAARELRKHGIRISVQDQPFEILGLLLEHPGQVVTRDELRTRIWPPDTFVNFEQSLNKAVNKLRDALGDTADNPRFIETVPRRGYRFIGQVKRIDPQDPVITACAGSAPNRSRYRQAATLLVTGCLLASAVIAGLHLPAEAPVIVRSEQLTNDGLPKWPCLFAGSSKIYFTEAEGGRYSVAEVSNHGGETHRLTAPFAGPRESVAILNLSPDQNQLLVLVGEFDFTTCDQPLWVMPTSGGSGQRLGNLRGHDGAWSPDQRFIAFANGNELFLANADGTEPRKLISAADGAISKRDYFIKRPSWSPDASSLRFEVSNDVVGSLWEVARDGTGLHRVLPSFKDSQMGGRWTPNGGYFVFVSDHNLWAVPETSRFFRRRERQPLQLTFGPIAYSWAAPSKDSRRLYAVGTQSLRRGELLRYDSNVQQFVPYLSGMSADGVEVSRDQKWITYVSYPDGQLWRSKLDGSEKLQLSSGPLHAYLPRWSPNGKQIVFIGWNAGKPAKMYIVSADGGTPEELFPNGRAEADPSWSPDGGKIVFAPWPWDIAPDITKLYVMDLKSRRVSPLSGSEHLWSPRWSPDGKYIAAVDEDRGLVLYELGTGKWKKIAGSAGFPYWSLDGKYVYFDRQATDAEGKAYRVDIHSGEIEDIAQWKSMPLTDNYLGAAWMGVTPTGDPLVLHEVRTTEIYGLDLRTR